MPLVSKGQWLELSVRVDAEAVESVTEVFSRVVPGGVAIEEDITVFGDREGYIVNADKPVTVRGYLPVDDTCGAKVNEIKDALDHLSMLRPVGELSLRQIAEEDWASAWKEHFQVHKVGRRTVIVPSWREYAPQPDEIVITLDPGMAFGTGLHPTTRLCLAELEIHLRPGMRVLDLGTGSGILAIAAAHLGAASVSALDTDAVAVEAARANVLANGVAAIVKVEQGTLASPTPRMVGRKPFVGAPRPKWDLVVCNIVAQVLIGLAEALATALEAGGLLITSGIINERADDVAAGFATQGLQILDRRVEGDWIALIATKPAL
jgi:ribosomal protein L11 methyltransferase